MADIRLSLDSSTIWQSLSACFLAHVHTHSTMPVFLFFPDETYVSLPDQLKIRNCSHDCWLVAQPRYNRIFCWLPDSSTYLLHHASCNVVLYISVLKYYSWLSLFAHLGQVLICQSLIGVDLPVSVEYPCFIPAGTMTQWAFPIFLVISLASLNHYV